MDSYSKFGFVRQYQIAGFVLVITHNSKLTIIIKIIKSLFQNE